jgi:hypothetical protein
MSDMTPQERARATARIYMHAKAELVKRHRDEYTEIIAEMYVLHGDPRVKQGQLIGELSLLRQEVARLKELVGE